MAAKRRAEPPREPKRSIERVQTGVRMERRILSVLKAIADLHGMALGDLLEGIVLHAFEGKAPFSGPSLEKIRSLKEVFGLDLTAADSHLLVEARHGSRARPRKETP
jgi:hypothetical protein